MFTYLLINLGTIFFPLILSFDKKVAYVRTWKNLFIAIAITGAFFIVWDEIFTRLGVWSFNPNHLIGMYIGSLPIEEWMFFITVPFASVFIYECLNAYLSKDYLQKISRTITVFLITFLFALGILRWGQLYISITFIIGSITLFVHLRLFGNQFLGKFYLAYLIHLIPFLIVNGILTSLPVVIYNDAENSGYRIGSIPVEDTIYGLILLLMNITILEYLRKNQRSKTSAL